MQHNVPLLVRFLSKLVLDVLPAALASVIGGFLFSQYQFNHASASQPAVEQPAPASAEMMKLVRDEHVRIIEMLKVQTAAAKSRLAAEDKETARAAAEAKVAQSKVAEDKVAEDVPAPPSRPLAPAARPTAPRGKAPAVPVAVATARPPVPAPAAQLPVIVVAAAAPADVAPPVETQTRDTNSLIGKTLDVKDHVVATTRRVVGVIGSIPAWLVWRGGGGNEGDSETSRSEGRFSDASS